MLRLIPAFVALVYLVPSEARAQTYPVKPVRLLVGFSAGGANDVTARLIAVKLSDELRQPVVVENRPGASGSISIQRVAASSPDGYTLLIMSSAQLLQSVLYPNLSYDLERDLAPISMVAIGPFVLVVHPSVPARNVKELIALARSQPGRLSYGSAGAGSTAHFAGEFFNLMAKVKIVHVPYKGSSQSALATAVGEVGMSYPSLTAALPLLSTGRLKAFAVTSAKRTSLMPSTPTLHELGLSGYDRSGWYGILTSAGVPREIVMRLSTSIAGVVNTATMKEAFNRQGLEPQTGTPEQFTAFIRGELAQGAQLVKATGVKAE